MKVFSARVLYAFALGGKMKGELSVPLEEAWLGSKSDESMPLPLSLSLFLRGQGKSCKDGNDVVEYLLTNTRWGKVCMRIRIYKGV